LLKEIELLFENGYFYTDIEKMFPKFYKDNKSKINFLYTQVLEERFKKTKLWKFKRILMFTGLDKSRLKSLKREDSSRKQLERIKNMIRKTQYDSDIHSYTPYKSKKEIESVLNDEIKKAEEESEGQKKFKRDDSDYTEDEEEFIIIERRADPLTVINTPVQNNVAPVETQPAAKHRRILCDDK
jgi:hypothetical protein